MMRLPWKIASVFAVVAFCLLVTAAVAPAAALAFDPVYLVNTIDTSAWSPPSPDPSGLLYLPARGRLLVVDGEVDEIPSHFQGFNVFETTLSGQLTGTFSTMANSQEPTGVTFDADRNDYFFTDDDRTRVFQVDPGPDNSLGTSDDVVGWFSTSDFGNLDPEGVTYANGNLYVTDGVGSEIYVVSPGANGLFDGVAPQGDDQVTHFDTLTIGVQDPEGVAFSPSSSSFFIIGTNGALIEVSSTGILLRSLDLSSVPFVAPADVALAPGSSLPSATHLYISDRGIDNGANATENDGKIYELTLDRSEFPPNMELLTNGGFEIDNNVNGQPDRWTGSAGFTRSAALVHGGTYSGLFSASDNSSLNVTQTVKYLTAGQTYYFSGWVNIPQTADALTFSLSIRWRDASDTLISTHVIKVYTGPTNGWDNATGQAVAPAGAVVAQISLQVDSLNASVRVDDFSLGAGGLPPTTTTTSSSTTTTTAPPATTTTTTLPPSGTETLTNGGFEIDVNGDGRPDSWTSSRMFTRSLESVHGHLYSGKIYSLDNANLTLSQHPTVSPGTTYSFAGWVNIPATTDVFTFKLQLKFRNSAGTVISIKAIKTYTAATAGWDNATVTAVAPTGAATASVQIDALSLGGAIFIDDFSLGAGGAPPTTTTTTAPPTTTTTTAPPTTTTTTAPPTTTTTTAPPTTTTTTAPPTTTTTTAPPTTTTTTAPPAVTERFLNPGFEIDANLDGRPDNWLTSRKFFRSTDLIRNGLFGGKLYALDNTDISGGQVVNVTPGTSYAFSGWVNIPATADAFTFKLQLKFRNSAGTVISIKAIKTYTAATAGWDNATAIAVAPAGAAAAYLQIDALSLGAAIYIDDFSLTSP